ncbi:hypothetical protein KSS87_001357 [Heliosperma pusillum]|nr:hypothetical protein KSS87_001357 [Heliosperma pusillum]
MLHKQGSAMRSLVITTGSSSSIVTPKHHHYHSLFFTPKHYPFLSKPTSPPPPSSSSSSSSPTTSVTLIPPHLHPSNNPHSTDSLSHYAEIASKLVEDGKFEEFKLVVESVINSEVGRNSGFGDLLDSKLLVCGIVKGLKEGRIKDVVGLFGCFTELGIDVLRVFDGSAMELLKKECWSLVSKGHLEEAVDLMEVLSGLKFPIKDLVKPSDMLRMFVSKRKPSLAVRYACLLPHAEVVFCTIIREFGKRADLQSAMKVFEYSKQKLAGHNMYIYRTMIDTCGLCGNCFKSRLIYEVNTVVVVIFLKTTGIFLKTSFGDRVDLFLGEKNAEQEDRKGEQAKRGRSLACRKKDLLNQKITPNIFVFNSLMNVNSHDLTYTMEVYKQMKAFAIEADLTSYNILLKACCLSERVDLAQDIYSEVFADAKLWQMAIKIKEDMRSAGVTPNTVTWSALISACANAGLVNQATQLFEEMLLAGCEPNSHCFNTLLHACVEACQYDWAFRLFYAWKSNGSSEKSTDIFSIQRIGKDPITIPPQRDTATLHLSFAKSIPFEPTTTTYNILLKACGRNFYHAKGLIDEMRAVNLSPDQISWSILIDICGAAGNVQGALQILKTMVENGMKPDVVAYTTAIKVRTLVMILIAATLETAEQKSDHIYKPSDYYLKLLIEEWCEGVLQKNNQESEYKLRGRADIDGLRSLLIDRVATHLQKSTTKSLVVDIQALTKILQAINLLLGFWCVHDVFSATGNPQLHLIRLVEFEDELEKDMLSWNDDRRRWVFNLRMEEINWVEARLIVLAALRMIRENYVTGCPVQDDLVVILGTQKMNDECTVKDAITKLLEKELGLEVLPANSSSTFIPKMSNSEDSDSESMLENKEVRTTSLDIPARRPAVLQRLVISKKSLNYWLTRKQYSSSTG